MTAVYLLILIPILVGIIEYFLPKGYKTIFTLLGQTAQFAMVIYVYIVFKGADTLIPLGGWTAPVGIMLHVDSISMVLTLLTSFLFLCFIIFNIYDEYSDKHFYMLYMILQGLLIGIFLVDDLFSIFVLVEVSTMVVSMLIMHKRDSRAIYDGLIYLLINTFSMVFFLFGLAMLYKQIGSFSITYISEAMKNVTNLSALYLPYALIITSVCLKSAIMPLFSWLPKAHGTPSAPSTVSAVLSGLYVKGGIYLYIRISTMFSAIDMSEFFLVCGFLTAIIGFIFAISQRDIKLILSYHTVSQLGLILLAINMKSEFATIGGVYHIINHAVFKSVLFLCAGLIADEYKTRNIYEIRGVFKRMPIVSIVCVCAILGITGAPLFNGSISKYFIASGSQNDVTQWLLGIINFGTILSFIKFSTIFAKDKSGHEYKKPRYSISRNAVLLTLALLCLLGGIFGTHIIELLFGVKKTLSASYFDKSLVYVATLIFALLVYFTGLTKTKPFVKIREMDLGFNNIAIFIPIFMCVVLVYLVFV
jgi:multicomponent Na+:H+ antiporter subunit D